MKPDTVNRSFRSEVTYLDHQYDMTVLEVSRAKDHGLYQLQLAQLKYWLIKKGRSWRFVADFVPTEKLRAVVIKEIERLTACIIRRISPRDAAQQK